MNSFDIFSPENLGDLKVLVKRIAEEVVVCGNKSLGKYTRVGGSLRGDLVRGCIVIEEGNAEKILEIIKCIFPMNSSAFVDNGRLFIKPNTMVLLFRTNFKGYSDLKRLYEEQYEQVKTKNTLSTEDICQICGECQDMVGCDNCDDWWICNDCIEKDHTLKESLKNHDQLHNKIAGSLKTINDLFSKITRWDAESYFSEVKVETINIDLQETIKSLKYKNILLMADNKLKQQALEEQASDTCQTCKKYKRKYRKIKGKNTYLTAQLNAVYKSEIENLQKRKREESNRLEKKTDMEYKRLKSAFSIVNMNH